MPSSHGFDAYCRKAETGGTVERICVALDVGLEMHDAFDARRPDGPTRLAVVLPALRTWIAQKAALAPKTQWGLVVLRDAETELLLAPTERDIMLATLNSVAQPRRRPDDSRPPSSMPSPCARPASEPSKSSQDSIVSAGVCEAWETT